MRSAARSRSSTGSPCARPSRYSASRRPQRPDRAAAIVAVGLALPEGVPGLLGVQVIGGLGDLEEFGRVGRRAGRRRR